MGKTSSREEYNAYMRVYMLRRYHRRRAGLIERLGGKCVDCGSTDNLEIDHTDPDDKSFEIGRRLAGVSVEKLEKEIPKCVLRCQGCHIKKSLRNGECTPGVRGNKGEKICRCGKKLKNHSSYAGHRTWCKA